MAVYIYSIPRFLPGPWAMGRIIPGPPPVQLLGDFVGCPKPAIPAAARTVEVLRQIATRLYVTPYIVARPWYVVPSYNRGSVFNYRF
jgi:hypothetical protein